MRQLVDLAFSQDPSTSIQTAHNSVEKSDVKNIATKRLKWILEFQADVSADKETALPVDNVSFKNANYEGANLDGLDLFD